MELVTRVLPVHYLYGAPIGRWDDPDMREQRKLWWETHDISKDPICSSTCLDVCRMFNDKGAKL